MTLALTSLCTQALRIDPFTPLRGHGKLSCVYLSFGSFHCCSSKEVNLSAPANRLKSTLFSSYLIIAPKTVRPGLSARVAVSIFQAKSAVTVEIRLTATSVPKGVDSTLASTSVDVQPSKATTHAYCCNHFWVFKFRCGRDGGFSGGGKMMEIALLRALVALGT